MTDPDTRSEHLRVGAVYRFFGTKEKDEEFAKHNAEGRDAIVVPATSKEA